MRRRWLAAVWAALLAATVGGCAASTGTDGDLTDDWRPATEARQFTPRAGECYGALSPHTSHPPVDCAAPHLVETFQVGTFPADVARRSAPPTPGSAAVRAAFAECDLRGREFAGGDWRGGRLSVRVLPVAVAGWRVGSRWFRCDMFELNAVTGVNGEDDEAVSRVGSLRGALRNDSSVRLGCMNSDEWARLSPAACTAPHQFEYAGVWTAPERSYEQARRDEETAHDRCRTVVAHYADVPADSMLRYRTGTTFRYPSKEAWTRGDRGVRCYFWSGGRQLTRSIAGGGPAILPIN
ncbi:septum formation family protein [Micromonospora musae]|uniref:septum formation family protein n=1 Tax=Micromonospora musae TaxID=1894970 RepID=UPI0033EDEBA7